jgi:hypothetical protein
LEIWNVALNSIEKKNRGTSSIQLNILILQLTVYVLKTAEISQINSEFFPLNKKAWLRISDNFLGAIAFTTRAFHSQVIQPPSLKPQPPLSSPQPPPTFIAGTNALPPHPPSLYWYSHNDNQTADTLDRMA